MFRKNCFYAFFDTFFICIMFLVSLKWSTSPDARTRHGGWETLPYNTTPTLFCPAIFHQFWPLTKMYCSAAICFRSRLHLRSHSNGPSYNNGHFNLFLLSKYKVMHANLLFKIQWNSAITETFFKVPNDNLVRRSTRLYVTLIT